MPSPNTITAFHSFTASTLIRSSQVNTNFALFRGHLMPIDASAAAFANNTYDLGSASYEWANAYIGILRGDTGLKPEVPTTTATPPSHQFYEADGTNYIGIRAPTTVTANFTMILPDGAPAANGRYLASDTDGRTYWTTSVSVIPTVTTSDIDTGAVTRSKLATGAVAAVNLTTVSAAFSCTGNEDVVLFTGATHTATLYGPTGVAGRQVKFIHRGSHFVPYEVKSAFGNIQGSDTATASFTMYTSGESITLVSDNTSWQVVDHYTYTGEVDAGAIGITATTTAPTKPNTQVVDKFYWSRITGTHCRGRYEFKNASTTGGASGTGQYIWLLPSGLEFDTDKITEYTANDQGSSSILGTGRAGNPGGNFVVGAIIPYNATGFRMGGYNSGGSGGYIGGSNLNVNQSNDLGYSFEFLFPVKNWRP
jgi:hypothetical protein